MRKLFTFVMLLSSLLLITAALSGCSGSPWLPASTANPNQLAFLRYTVTPSVVNNAIRGERSRAARAARRAMVRSNPAAAVIVPGGFDIYLTSVTSLPGSERKVSPASGMFESVKLSRDGAKAVFTAQVLGSDDVPYLQIFVANSSDPSNATQITTDLEDHYDPQFSPDSTTIVFAYWNETADNDQLGFVPAAGGTESKDFPGLVAMDIQNPTYTPDGAKVVFEDCNQDDLFIMNVDGSGLTQLTSQGTDRIPSVSSDGTKIVFERETIAGSDIYIMGIGGETEAAPAVALTGDGANPPTVAGVSFEPMFVNNKIVFVTDLDEDGDIDLYTMNPDGTGITALTDTVEDDCLSLYNLYW